MTKETPFYVRYPSWYPNSWVPSSLPTQNMYSCDQLLARICLLLGSSNLLIRTFENYFWGLLLCLPILGRTKQLKVPWVLPCKNPSLSPTLLKFGSEIILKVINKSSMIELSLVSIPGSQVLQPCNPSSLQKQLIIYFRVSDVPSHGMPMEEEIQEH